VQGVELLKTAERECEIDFSEVTRAGSAGVSLLLSWLRCASARDIKVVFSHLPEDLLGVARVSGVDKFLPVTS
jgi:phospholipid transport system transporter-binding protein